MASVATRASAWTTSVAVHAVIGALLMIALGHGHRHETEERPSPLVYVEPVAAPLARPDGEAAPAPVPESPRVEVSQPAAREHAPVARRLPPVAAKSLAARHPTAEPPVSAAETLPPHDAPVSVSANGSVGGSVTGVVGGAVGGLGDVPLALRDVAAPPELVTRVLPDYPARARAMQIEGQVLLEVVLDRSGRVEDEIRVARSIPALDAAAIAAVKQWRFRPGRDRNGQPVRVRMEVPVRFVLR